MSAIFISISEPTKVNYEGESSIEYNLAVAPLFLNKILAKWTQNEAFVTVHLKKLSNFNFDSA